MQIRKRMNFTVLVPGLLSLLLLGCGKTGSRTFPSVEVMKNEVLGMYRMDSGDAQFIMEITGDDKINIYAEDASGKSKNLGTYTVTWSPKNGSLLMKGDTLEKEIFVLENGSIQNEGNTYVRIEDNDAESISDKDGGSESNPEKMQASSIASILGKTGGISVNDSDSNNEDNRNGSVDHLANKVYKNRREDTDSSTENETDESDGKDEDVTVNHNEVSHKGTFYIEPRNDYTITDTRFSEMGEDFTDDLKYFFMSLIPWFNSVDITSSLPIDFVDDSVEFFGGYILKKYVNPNQAIIKDGDYYNTSANRKIALCYPFVMAYGGLSGIILHSPGHMEIQGTLNLENPNNSTTERTITIDISLEEWEGFYNDIKAALSFYYEGAPVEEYYQQFF